MKDDAEFYFIQLLFTKNPDLLRREYRDLYDAMFTRYEKSYLIGKKMKVDLMDINIKFMKSLR
jgi:hypothetical protein